MIGFQNIIGSGPGQVPEGATVNSAYLTYTAFDGGDPANIHEAAVDWTESETFNSFGGDLGVQVDEYGPLIGTGSGSTGAIVVDVTSSLAAWTDDPTGNHGWIFLPTGGNGVDLRSSEWSTVAERPMLTVVYAEALESLYESFEGGLSADWTITNVDPESRVAIRDLAAESIVTGGPSLQFTQNGNNNALTFDSTNASGDGAKDLGLAIWSADLSAVTGAILTYHQFEGDGSGSGDENDLLPDSHATNTTGDGIAMSVNGTDWYTLLDQNGSDLNRSGDSLWQLHEIDLAAEIARINTAFPAANLALSSNVQLKWSQWDDRSLPNDGWAIDEIRIQSKADEFTTNRPLGAFHRFNLAGENDEDYFYRAAFFGNVDANTPILVSTHGDTSSFNYESYARRWHRFAADPANDVSSLIVVTPVFAPFAKFDQPHGHHRLSWNDTNGAAADLALLATVDAIAATGFGDASQLYLWGFSAGGQFTTRFTAAHPGRVAAAVVGGPGSQILPTESIAWPYGFGGRYDSPAPAGVSLDIDQYLKSRIQFWVGENDNDPNHPQIDKSNTVTSVQGEDRVEQSVNTFEAVVAEAANRGIPAAEFEFEIFVAADDAHSWGEDDLAQIYEFMFRSRNQIDLPVRVHPRLVLLPSLAERTSALPQNVAQLDSGQQFFAELWVEAPSGGVIGVRSGQVDLYFDPAVATIVSPAIEHGSVFDTSTGHSYDPINNPAFIRSFTGATTQSGVGVGEYALFGRVELTASASEAAPTQFAAAFVRPAGLDFQLEDLSNHRTDLMPFQGTTVDADGQGVQGVVFEDADANGAQDPGDAGLAGRLIELQTIGGAPVTLFKSIEPDSYGDGSYLNNASPWVVLSAVGPDVLSSGVRAIEKTSDDASTGVNVFGNFRTSEVATTWLSGQRSLRVDFNAPGLIISVDAVGTAGGNDVARLDVYDASGTLLVSYITATLAEGVFETMTLARPAGDIAYAIATGDGDTVRLDHLQFEVRPVILTDAEGEYLLNDLDTGAFNLVAETPAGWSPTNTLASIIQVDIAAGALLARQDFGQQEAAPLPEVEIVATDSSASEAGLETGEFTLTRTGDTSSSLIVDLTISVTADNGVDYQTIAGTATILAGSSLTSITVTPIDDGDVESGETVVLTIAASPEYSVGVSASDVVTITSDDVPPPASTDDDAISESTTRGNVSPGDLTSTYESGGGYEVLTEQAYGGGKRSRLEHEWMFNVSGGSAVTFNVEAHHDSAVEDFVFQYSTDLFAWTTMLTITKSADDGALQMFDLPDATSGAFYVRTLDTDRSRPEGSADSLLVDHMFIRSTSGGGTALPQVSVTATDPSADEAGDTGQFTVNRRRYGCQPGCAISGQRNRHRRG